MPRGVRLLLFVGFATTLPSVVTMTRMEGAQSQRSAFRVGIDLVSLSVTATDSSQRYVPDLAGRTSSSPRTASHRCSRSSPKVTFRWPWRC